MKKTRDSGSSISGIIITPIIDVTLVLVIIMLVCAPVMNIPNMNVNLPEAVTTETKEKNIAISLGKDGRLALDQEILPLDSLVNRLAARLQKDKKTMVILRADKEVLYSDVENLIETLKSRSRAQNISVATQQRKDKIVK